MSIWCLAGFLYLFQFVLSSRRFSSVICWRFDICHRPGSLLLDYAFNSKGYIFKVSHISNMLLPSYFFFLIFHVYYLLYFISFFCVKFWHSIYFLIHFICMTLPHFSNSVTEVYISIFTEAWAVFNISISSLNLSFLFFRPWTVLFQFALCLFFLGHHSSVYFQYVHPVLICTSFKILEFIDEVDHCFLSSMSWDSSR